MHTARASQDVAQRAAAALPGKVAGTAAGRKESPDAALQPLLGTGGHTLLPQVPRIPLEHYLRCMVEDDTGRGPWEEAWGGWPGRAVDAALGLPGLLLALALWAWAAASGLLFVVP